MGKFKSRKPRTGFSNPAIDLGSDVKRVWKHIPSKDIQKDDIVSGLGKVVSVSRTVRPFVDIEAGVPESSIYRAYELDIFFVFVKRSD
jgi:hypothetical protein